MLNVIYLFEAIWGLTYLDFTGYNKIYPDFVNLGAFFGPFTGLLGVLRDTKSIFLSFYI